MDILSAIEGRRSIRQYSNKPIEEEKLLKVLEATKLLPSAKNRQEWRFVVAITPLGYPNESPALRPRKQLDEIISYDKY